MDTVRSVSLAATAAALIACPAALSASCKVISGSWGAAMLVTPAVVTSRTSVQADKAYVAPASSTKARQRASLFLCMADPVRTCSNRTTTGSVKPNAFAALLVH
jgi:hypothetical protein